MKALHLNTTATASYRPTAASALTVHALEAGQEAEVLSFLALRPLHTVIMACMIRDNGLVSSLNRGTFHGCRDDEGALVGVALLGHVTMVETDDTEALRLLSELAQQHQRTHVIIGEHDRINRFWRFYGPAGQAPRTMCREILLEQRFPIEVMEPVNLRLATLADIDLVAPVHAQMAFEESGINPLQRDPEGFRARVARRIELGRVWVLIEEGRLIFKADIQADTPEQLYLEGIYTDPNTRGKGYGVRCLSQLSRMLLEKTRSLCVLVNEKNVSAQAFYSRSGYKKRGAYDTIFLHTQH